MSRMRSKSGPDSRTPRFRFAQAKLGRALALLIGVIRVIRSQLYVSASEATIFQSGDRLEANHVNFASKAS